MKYLKFIGDNLKDRMTEQSISGRQLAKMTGIDQGEISRILSGKKNITVETLLKLTTALKVDKLNL